MSGSLGFCGPGGRAGRPLIRRLVEEPWLQLHAEVLWERYLTANSYQWLFHRYVTVFEWLCIEILWGALLRKHCNTNQQVSTLHGSICHHCMNV